MTLVEQILSLDRALVDAKIPHTFGGALALAWCTQRARATIDIDLNLFVDLDRAGDVLRAFPDGVRITDDDRERIAADGQQRLWWDKTSVDVFFKTTPFHEAAADRARVESFGGERVPFLACRDLAAFKGFSDRTKDRADREEMAAADTLDVEAVLGVLVACLGGDDPPVARLRAVGIPPGG